MVYLPALEAMRREFNENLRGYIQEHPGEFVLFERGLPNIQVSFYRTQEELKEAIAKYNGLFGPTFFSGKIPLKTHRFNKGNKTLEFLDEFVEVCPNDGETKLEGEGPVSVSFDKGVVHYQELAFCPDCKYKVFRKPSDETIKRVEENMKRPIC